MSGPQPSPKGKGRSEGILLDEIDQCFYFAPSALHSFRQYLSFLGRCPRLFHFGPLALSSAPKLLLGQIKLHWFLFRIPFSSCATVVYNGRSCRLNYAGFPLTALKNVGFIFRRDKSARLIRVALACPKSARLCRAAGHVSLVQWLGCCSGPEDCLETW